MFRVNGEEASERGRDRPAWYHGHIAHKTEDRAGCLPLHKHRIPLAAALHLLWAHWMELQAASCLGQHL